MKDPKILKLLESNIYEDNLIGLELLVAQGNDCEGKMVKAIREYVGNNYKYMFQYTFVSIEKYALKRQWINVLFPMNYT